MCCKMVTFVLKHGPDLDIIINFAVVNNLVAVGKAHGLGRLAAKVNNSKPPVSQVNRVAGIAPLSFAIGAAMRNGIGHFF